MIPLVSIRTGRELGWPEGLEPSTGGSTNRCSAIELWPPRSEREYSPKARAAAKDCHRRRPAPTTPSKSRRPLTTPNPPYLPGTRPDRTVPGDSRRPDESTADIPQSPTYRGHITRIPPDTPGVRSSHVFPHRFRGSTPHPIRSGSRGVATADRPRDRPAVRHQLGVHVRCAVRDLRLGYQLVQLLVGGRPRRADQPQPRERRAQGAPGRQHARLGRPLAQQGHDPARLLQPLHPGLRQGLGQAPRHRLLLQGRRREHRLEQLPGRHRDRRDPQDVHGLVRPPRQHHGQGLGRHRRRRLQGSDRQEDVDRPVRRQVRRDLDRAQADGQAHPPADPPRDAATDDAPQGDAATDRQAEARQDRDPGNHSGPRARADRRADAAARSRRPLPGDEPVTEPTDEPEVVQPTDDPSDGFDGAVGMRVQDRTSTDGLLSTIVGGVTGYFFGG